MKRFFPRALLEAIGLLGLVLFLNEGCSEDQSVKPGAPVLTQLTIVEEGKTPTNINADTPVCDLGTSTDGGADAAAADAGTDADAGAGAATVTDGGADDGGADAASDDGGDAAAEAAAPMSVPDEPAATGAACDPAKHGVCKKSDDWCRCLPDPADMTMTMGIWNCDAFAPQSVVVATFDRLLDTDPLDPGDAGNTSRDDISMLTATPTPAVAVSSATDYSSTGSATGSVFNVYGPYLFMNYRSGGPSLQIGGSPALPTDSKVTITLDPSKVMAKDGKTPFAAMGMLASGSLTFKTASFQLGVGVPTAPPPAPADGGVDAEADGGDAAATGASDGGDATADASDAKADAADGGAAEVSVPDASLDAVVDAVVAEAGVDAGLDAKVDADAIDGALAEVGASDAAAATPPSVGDPVPLDMNTGAVTLTFNNLVGMDVLDHIKITEDGKPFTDFLTLDQNAKPVMFPTSFVALAPKTMWAAGKTYVVTVDANTVDVVGDKLGAPVAAAFMLATK